jgi:CRP-like cAMP-binding protein
MATATAISDCSIVRFEKAAMIRALREEPAFSEMFLAYVLSRNMRIEENLLTSSSIPVRRGWRGCFCCCPTSEKKVNRSG